MGKEKGKKLEKKTASKPNGKVCISNLNSFSFVLFSLIFILGKRGGRGGGKRRVLVFLYSFLIIFLVTF